MQKRKDNSGTTVRLERITQGEGREGSKDFRKTGRKEAQLACGEVRRENTGEGREGEHTGTVRG